MVDAEKSGVMFTSHPSTGDPQITIEAAWGLGEAVVSGTVSPDNYVYDRERGAVDEVTVADKKVEMVKDAETGETVTLEVDDERRNSRVLSDEEIAELVELGKRVEDHYGTPQDVEWAIYAGDIYMLQSRPITTIQEDAGSGRETDTGESAENIALVKTTWTTTRVTALPPTVQAIGTTRATMPTCSSMDSAPARASSPEPFGSSISSITSTRYRRAT